MLNQSEPACLVIADIAGYTGYLAGTELDHAQDILADLMGVVVGALRPTFRLAKLEGDAAFVYAFTEAIDGSALQDTIERCYFAFRRRLRDIKQASACECNACILIPNLDLKFVAHHGLVARQRIAGRDELAGSAVVVAHRLLKNSINEALGFAAYALYSADCVAAMQLADPKAAGLVEHHEAYEHLGEVIVWVRDLGAAWRAETERSRVRVGPSQAMWSVEAEYAGPPEVVWEWVTSPVRRPRWQAGVVSVVESSPSGRRGTGTTNHCIHGRDAIIEEVVDWRPFDYLTIRFQVPVPGAPKLLMTEVFEAVEGGTRVTATIAKPRSKADVAAAAQLAPMLDSAFRAGIAALGPLIAADMADRTAAAANATEPSVPPSGGSFLVAAPGAAGPRHVDSGGSRSSQS